MERFEVLCTPDEAIKILEKKNISQQDISKIASMTPPTLVDNLEKLTNSEISEVYLVESKNVNNLLIISLGLLGDDPHILRKIMGMSEALLFFRELSKVAKNKQDEDRAICSFLFKYTLADFDLNKMNAHKVFFQGKIPQKPFSFRQDTAEKWFKNYCSVIIIFASQIYGIAGSDAALSYIFQCTAYYLNKSQTFKYYKKSSDNSIYDTLYRIIKEAISEKMSTSDLAKIKTKILYKDI